MEVPEVTEFDVYLDIDGAVEEEEDTLLSENGEQSVAAVVSDEQSSQPPSELLANGHGSGSSSTVPDAQKDGCVASTSHGCVASTSRQTLRDSGRQMRDSDNEEVVDVDTPFDGKLFGQTQARNEPSSQTTLSTLLKYTSNTSSPTEHRRPAILKRSAVARKSTTQKKFSPVVSSAIPILHTGSPQSSENVQHWSTEVQQVAKKIVANVARKSTAKPSKFSVSSFGAKTEQSKAKTGNVLQVKFGPGKYQPKVAPHATTTGFSKMSTMMKKTSAVPETFGRRIPVAFPVSPTQGSKKVFPCDERSGDRIACPECSIVVKTYCLRSHLKTVHNMPMKNCKRCKITFTDLNLYSEHYAQHLQEEEGSLKSLSSTPVNATVQFRPQAEYSDDEESETPAEMASSGLNRYQSEAPVRSRPLQMASSPTKRKLTSPFSRGPVPKFRSLANEIQSAANKFTYPGHSKLPPKPRKPRFHPRKRFSSFLHTSQAASDLVDDSASWQSEESDTVEAPVRPKLPAKPRRPFSSSKMSHLCSSGRRDSGSSRERRSSTASLQSEELSNSESSETARPASTLYKENRKMANRRPVFAAQDQPPSKKPFLGATSAAPVTKKYRGKATVSLVSLETASRPYDCKKCLAAFKIALASPRAFRQYSQSKPYACGNCSAAFTYPEELKTHQDQLCSATAVKSETDDLSFRTSLRRQRVPDSQPSEDLAQDVPAKSHGKGALFECRKCKETFPYRSLLLRHFPYHSYQYSCGVCKKAYVKKVDLLNHLQIMHDGRMLLRCKYCETKFEDMAEFEEHIYTHKDGTVVPCTVCGKIFSSARKMQVHLTVTHGVYQKTDCETCGKRFKQAKLLAIHMRVVHKTVKPVISCKVCGRRFKQSRLLSLHMKVAHKTANAIVTKILSCRYCHKVFHNKQGLSAHYKLRHGVSFAFAMTAESSRSVKNSAQKNAQAAPQNPGSSAGIKLQINSAIDLNNKRCKICGKKYSKRKVLVSHYRHVHQIEPTGTQPNALKCQICSKVLFSLQGLKVHYKVRHRRKIPESTESGSKDVSKPAAKAASSAPASTSTKRHCRCGKCGKFFLYTWSLFRHQRLYHRNSAQSTFKAKSVPVQETQSHSLGETSVERDARSFKGKKQWVCCVCGKSFRLRKSMRLHVKNEHPNSFTDERCGGRKCHKCKKAFGSKAKLLLHLKTCGLHTRGPNVNAWIRNSRYGDFKCTLCGKVFHWRQNLVRHMQQNHHLSKEVVTYNMTHQKLAQSEKGSVETKLYLCKICKVCFTGRESLSRHLKRRHGGLSGDFQCRRRHCKKVFMRNDVLLHHIRTAHPDMSVYWCQGCSSGFETSSDLFSHRCDDGSHSQASASTSWQDGGDEEDAPEQNSIYFTAEQECRYRCMICDMGFHIAREWTKHMQEHTEKMGETSESARPREDMVEPTEKVKVSMFDLLSGSSIFSCKYCSTIFNNEDEMNRHICRWPRTVSSEPKKAKKKRPARNLEPVKCTVCLKFFSPLSIKRHMMRIHSLPMRICSKCNIVFTDLERFRRHNEYHSQREDSRYEDTAVAPSVDEDVNDDSVSVTYFICQACGGLFSDTDRLASHACAGGIAETSEIQYESEDDLNVNAQEGMNIVEDKSSETNTSDISDYFSLASQAAESTAVYVGSRTENEGVTESRTIKTLCGDERGYGFATGIVIESVSSGAAAAGSEFSGYGKEGTVSTTGTVMKVENPNSQVMVPLPAFSISVENPETSLTASDTSKLLTSHSYLEEHAVEPQEQIQHDSPASVPVRATPSCTSSETVIAIVADTGMETAITGGEAIVERPEMPQPSLSEEMRNQSEKICLEVNELIQDDEVYPEATSQCERADQNTSESGQFEHTVPESAEFEEAAPETGNAEYEETALETRSAEFEHTAPETGSAEFEHTAPETGSAEFEHTAPETRSAEFEHTAPEIETAEFEHTAPEIESAEFEHTAPEIESAEFEHTAPETGNAVFGEAAPESACSESAQYGRAHLKSGE